MSPSRYSRSSPMLVMFAALLNRLKCPVAERIRAPPDHTRNASREILAPQLLDGIPSGGKFSIRTGLGPNGRPANPSKNNICNTPWFNNLPENVAAGWRRLPVGFSSLVAAPPCRHG